MRSAGLILAAALVQSATATYILEDDYQPKTWFDQFRFFSAKDPTHAYVNYLGQAEAQSQNLIGIRNNAVFLGVDYNNTATGEGRSSVRLETKKVYNHGLIIADINHMPGGECGTWPAFWTTSSAWPNEGELDIIEGVNRQQQNDFALHTGPGCNIAQQGDFTGKVVTPNCDVRALGQAENQGCLVEDTKPHGYGPAFNNAGGGIFATEWTSDGIAIWFFPRGKAPADINGEHPDPSKWADKPIAHFAGSCDLDKHVRNQRIIFNTAFCGGWAEGLWPNDPVCSKKAPTCIDWVRDNPSAFKEAFWSINYMKVYQQGSVPTQPSQAPPAPSSSQLSTTSSTSTIITTTTKASSSAPQSTTVVSISSSLESPVPRPSTGSPITHSTTIMSSSNSVSQPISQPTKPSTSLSSISTQPTSAPSGKDEHASSDCPKPTRTTCQTFVKTTVLTIVKTIHPTEPAPKPTKGSIIAIPSGLGVRDEGASRRRQRDMAYHAGRGRHI